MTSLSIPTKSLSLIAAVTLVATMAPGTAVASESGEPYGSDVPALGVPDAPGTVDVAGVDNPFGTAPDPLAGAPDPLSAVAGATQAAGAVLPQAAGLPQISVARMASRLRLTAASSPYLRGYLSGVVLDQATGRVVWSHYAGRAKMPASTQKVLTAYTVLRSMKPSTAFVTRTLQGTRYRSNVYLRGAGDPSLSHSRLSGLALRTATILKAQRRRTVNLYLDATIFPAPTMATGWKTSYLRGDVQHVRGLTFAGYRGADGTLAVGRSFVSYLKSYGITARLRGKAATPAASRIAQTTSAPVASLLATMLSRSSNDYAEYLFRQAARFRGYPATWGGAYANQRYWLRRAGVNTRGYVVWDGSGLSRANRMPTATLAGVLQRIWGTAPYRKVAFAWGAMPRSGQSGTLYSRFRTTAHACAKGRVYAKTGTLNDVVSLAGIALGKDGRQRVFVLLENGRRETKSVRYAIDTLATTAAACNF